MRLGESSTTPARLQAANAATPYSSSRLFQIALQATVANADAARAESDTQQAKPQAKRPSQGTHHRSVHLTPQQWQLLTDYHEHELFVRTRSWGFCLAIFGVGVAVFGMGSPAWKWIGDVKNPYEMGLWAICYPNASCLPVIYYLDNDWKMHTSIICFLGCGCLFGFLGLGLAVTGACRSALIPRMYYYHSAGECFLVSGIATGGSLILYPISATTCIRNLIASHIIQLPETSEDTDIQHRFAYNYYLTWCASAFFLASFVCMNLDLMIQSFVRPRPFLTALCSYLTQRHSYSRRPPPKTMIADPVVNNSPRPIKSNSSNSTSSYVNNVQSGTEFVKETGDKIEHQNNLVYDMFQMEDGIELKDSCLDDTEDSDWI